MAVVVPMTVAPIPVFLLLPGRQLAKIAMGIAVVFAGPLLVIDHFVLVPDMVVAVVGVIDPIIVMFGASRAQYGRRQGSGQKSELTKRDLLSICVIVLLSVDLLRSRRLIDFQESKPGKTRKVSRKCGPEKFPERPQEKNGSNVAIFPSPGA